MDETDTDPYERFVKIASEIVKELQEGIKNNDPDYINSAWLLEEAKIWLDRGQRRVLEGAYDTNLRPRSESNYGKLKDKVNELEYIFKYKIKTLPPRYPSLN